jgi:hypothetical protein
MLYSDLALNYKNLTEQKLFIKTTAQWDQGCQLNLENLSFFIFMQRVQVSAGDKPLLDHGSLHEFC